MRIMRVIKRKRRLAKYNNNKKQNLYLIYGIQRKQLQVTYYCGPSQ